MKEKNPKIVVLYGGVSNEREVSLISGKRVANDLSQFYEVELVEVTTEELPQGLDPDNMVIVPMLHGYFGEDGKLQRLLEDASFEYAGSGVDSSALCMNKIASKRRVEKHGVRVAPDVHFTESNKPSAAEVIAKLGNEIVVKPVCEGSTLGVALLSGEAEVQKALDGITSGYWMMEQRIFGTEVSVGVLDGRSLGVVGINAEGGFHDYKRKYTPGLTKHELPADLPKATTLEIQKMTEIAFHFCSCRDFARADFMIDEAGVPYFLEINTHPGMTPTSIYPDSGLCMGIEPAELCRRMVANAFQRHQSKLSIV